jgi:hypothetical protein
VFSRSAIIAIAVILGLGVAASRQDRPLATSYSVGRAIGVKACQAVVGERESQAKTPHPLGYALVTVKMRALPPQYRAGAASGCAADYA